MSPVRNNSSNNRFAVGHIKGALRAPLPTVLIRPTKLTQDVSVEQSRALARAYDASAHLDYIPMHACWRSKWIDNDTFWSQVYGRIRWVGREDKRPRDAEQLQRTKMFVCRMCVAPTVMEVVVRSGWEHWKSGDRVFQNEYGRWWVDNDRVKEWVEDAKNEWGKKVPSRYEGLVGGISPKEMFELAGRRNITLEQFKLWCNQRAWDHGNEDLEGDMAALEAAKDKRPDATAKWAEYRSTYDTSGWKSEKDEKEEGEVSTWAAFEESDPVYQAVEDVLDDVSRGTDPAPTKDLDETFQEWKERMKLRKELEDHVNELDMAIAKARGMD